MGRWHDWRTRRRREQLRRIEKAYPELRLVEDEDDRWRLFRKCCRPRTWRDIALLVGIGVTVGIPVGLLAGPAGQFFGITRLQHLTVGGLQGSLMGGLIGYWYEVYRIPRDLRARLAEMGLPICAECDYDLRGQVEPRCPECGRAFDPSILKKEL